MQKSLYRGCVVIGTLLLLLLVLATVLPVAIKAGEFVYGYARVVTLNIGGKIYVVALNISCYYDPSVNELTILTSARLVYPTQENAKIFLVADIVINGNVVSSLVYGYLLPGKSSTAGITIKIMPPPPSSIALIYRGFADSQVGTTKIVIPLLATKVQPMLTISARFENGLPYTIIFAGSRGYERVHVYISNTGAAKASGVVLEVFEDGAAISSYYIGEIPAGSGKDLNIVLPIPSTPGEHMVMLRARCAGSTSETVLKVYVLVKPIVVLRLLNDTATFYQGDRICFEISVLNLPGNLNSTLALEYSYDNGVSWHTLWINTTPSRRNVVCITASLVGNVVYRAKLNLIYNGINMPVLSNTVSTLVSSVVKMVANRKFVLRAKPSVVYVDEVLSLEVSIVPPLTRCVRASFEVMRPSTVSWEPLQLVSLCGNGGVYTLPAGMLGPGSHWIALEIYVGAFSIKSNSVLVKVYEKPKLWIDITPKISPPRGYVELSLKLRPAIPRMISVTIKPSWRPSINATIINGTASLILRAPEEPGNYSIQAIAYLIGAEISSVGYLTVAKPSLTLNVTPITVAPDGEVKAHIALTPPLNTNAVLLVVGSGGRTYIVRSIGLVKGVGETVFRAPSTPGNYTVIARVPQLGIEDRAALHVVKRTYRVNLVISPTRVRIGERVEAVISIVPPPPKPVMASLLIKVNNTWKLISIAEISAASKTIYFTAPSKPGSYDVQVAIEELGATSNIATLTVYEIQKKPAQIFTMNTLIMLAGGIAVVSALSSIIAVKRRR